MRKATATMAAIVALAGGVLVAPASANSTPGCATSREFAKVRNGMSKSQVAKKFGANGKRSTFARSGSYTIEIRSYRACSQFGTVAISFSNGRVNAKTGVF